MTVNRVTTHWSPLGPLHAGLVEGCSAPECNPPNERPEETP